jgi:hypothetical protein
MTISYPNREHEREDHAARRRALAALRHLTDEAEILAARIASGIVDGDDSQRISDLARDLTQHLSILGTLRQVREWHAADTAETGEH